MLRARTLAKWTGLAFAAVLALVVLLVAGVQTGPGKAMLARLGSQMASSPDGLKVEISGIRGFVPTDMSIERVALADSKGPFGEVEGAHVAFSLLALLGGTLDISDAGATRVALSRLPELPPATDASESGGGGFALPVRVGRFAVDEIDLAEPVLGHAAKLSLTASAELLALERGLSAAFDLKRQDEPGSIAGRLHYVPSSASLDLDLSAEEPAGGLIARAAGLEGLPAVTATLKGAGPLDGWDGHLNVAAGDVAQVTGAAGVRAAPGGRRVTFAIDADVARLLPAAVRPLLEGRTELTGAATVSDQLAIAIEDAKVQAAGFGAGVKGSIDARAMTGDLSFDLKAGDAGRFAALAPGIAWRSVTAAGTLKGAFSAPAIVAQANARELKGAGYGVAALDVNAATTPDRAQNLGLTVTGRAEGMSADDPKVAKALGTGARFSLTGAKPKTGPAAVSAMTIELAPLTGRFTGTASAETVDGTLKLEKLDLAALSPLAGHPMTGTATLDAKVTARDHLSRVNVTLKGGAEDLATGIAAIDGLFGGTTTLSGALARDGENAIRVNALKLAATGLSVTADGTISRARADLAANLSVADVSKLDPRVTGTVNGEVAFSGTLDNLGLTARLAMPSGTAMKQKVEGLGLDVTATDLTRRPAARFNLGGRVAGKPATGSGAFAMTDAGAKELRGLALAIGSVTAAGNLDLAASGIASGQMKVTAGDLNDLSPLVLTELAGKLDADVRLDGADGKQRVAIKATGENIAAAGQQVGRAFIDASVVDPAGVPLLDGTVKLDAVKAGGMDIPRVDLAASRAASGTNMKLDATVNGASLATAGVLSQSARQVAFRLDSLRLARGNASLATSAPANFTWADNNLSIDRLALATRGGSATVSGRAGERLDLNVDLKSLPLSLADLASPGLGLSGTLNATARIEGPAARPSGNYTLAINQLNAAQLASSGVGPLTITADGRLADGRVGTNARIAGRYLTGLTVTGSAPLGAGALDLAIRGAVDLALANPSLATSGAQVRGRADINATVRGTAAEPRAGGTVRITGARFDDSVNGVNLSNIDGVITGTERSVTITSLSARTPNGGSLTGRGSVALDPAAGFPGNIAIDLTNAGLVNSELMRLVAEGRVTVDGAFANAPRVGGRLVVRALDVNIAERLPGGAETLNVRHVNTGSRWRSSATGRAAAQRAAPQRASGGMPLDLTVSAPNNVFVRGMGLEAELGGDIRLSGTTAAPATIGAFEMRRGTFDILGRRLTFTRGKITFAGTPDPELDFVAEATANDITAQILVTGSASRPEVAFTSTPSLPQDEVLSRLMFGRSAGSLTGAQALQVAQTIAQFSSGGGGVLNDLRRTLGLDSLNVGTNSTGNGAQVGIGKRLNDRLSIGVNQGTTPGASGVTVDLDITKNIRLQGSTGIDGAANVGIGAQWDY